MISHAHKRARERYQINGALDAQFFSGILRTIRDGRAKRVWSQLLSGGDGLIYDVPTDHKAYSGIIRVIVPPDLSRLITILPPMTPGEIEREKARALADQRKAQRKKFFRELRDDEGDDDVENYLD